jgi:hypothetical protein
MLWLVLIGVVLVGALLVVRWAGASSTRSLGRRREYDPEVEAALQEQRAQQQIREIGRGRLGGGEFGGRI